MDMLLNDWNRRAEGTFPHAQTPPSTIHVCALCDSKIRSLDGRKSGAVLPTVMVIMTVLLAIGAGVIEYVQMTELTETEKSLADVRVYWAMTGHFNAMASIARQERLLCVGGACAENDSNNLVQATSINALNFSTNSVIGYFQDRLNSGDEIQTRDGISNFGFRTWTYPVRTGQVNANIYNGSPAPYTYEVWSLVRPRDQNSSGNANEQNALNTNNIDNDGLSIMDIELNRGDPSAYSKVPGLKDIRNRFQRVVIGFCVIDSTAISANSFSNRGCISTNTPDDHEGEIRIQFIQKAHNCFLDSDANHNGMTSNAPCLITAE